MLLQCGIMPGNINSLHSLLIPNSFSFTYLRYLQDPKDTDAGDMLLRCLKQYQSKKKNQSQLQLKTTQ